MAQSLRDLKFFRNALESAHLSCDALEPVPHPEGGANELFLLEQRKKNDLGLFAWNTLNSAINRLGYCAVFIPDLSSLEALVANKEWARDFYGLDIEEEKGEGQNLFQPHTGLVEPGAAGKATNPGRFLALLADLVAPPEPGRECSGAGFNDILGTAGRQSVNFTEILRFLEGESLSFSPEAIEEAAKTLERLEAVENTPRLSRLRQEGCLPKIQDYEFAAQEELDIDEWLSLRRDPALEGGKKAFIPELSLSAWSLQDWPVKLASQLIAQCRYLLFVPVARTELVPAFFHFGGYSGTPPAHIHLAMLRRWRSRFGARLLAVDHDSLSFYIEKPATDADVTWLAAEQFRYCPERVTRAAGSIDYLARALVDSDIWQFTWG